jgi:hypothetical protein
MSITIDKELLGFVVPVVGVAESMQELADLSGSDKRAVGLANNYILYHQHYTKLRSTIAEVVEKLSGIRRIYKKSEKTGKLIIDENDEPYINRVEEELGEGSLKQFVSAVREECEKLAVDYTVAVRAPGSGGKLAKKWLEAYNQLVESGKIAGFISKYEVDIEGLDEEETKIVCANKIKEVILKKQQEEEQRQLAAL